MKSVAIFGSGTVSNLKRLRIHVRSSIVRAWQSAKQDGTLTKLLHQLFLKRPSMAKMPQPLDWAG
jgi:hypothetical protein